MTLGGNVIKYHI